MPRRFSFDIFRDMVLLAVLCGGVFEGLLVVVGPQVTACFCSAYPAHCPCPRPIPAGLSASVPGLIQVWSVLVMALVPLSLLVGLVGIFLGRRAAATVDVHLVHGLKLCPLLILLFLEVLT
jgi:hypothetical protein